MSETVQINLSPVTPIMMPIAPMNSRFILVYMRANWEMRIGTDADGSGDKVVPDLIAHTMQGGINGIGESVRGNDPEIFEIIGRNARDVGGVVLPPNAGPRGHGYLASTVVRDANDGTRTGKHYHPPWHRFYPGSALVEEDAAVFDEFVAYWVEAGLMSARPTHDVIVAKINDVSGRLARLQEREIVQKSNRRRLLERELACFSALLASRPPASAPDAPAARLAKGARRAVAQPEVVRSAAVVGPDVDAGFEAT